jgi:SPP1 family predicted phage head-tail adaptor
MNPGKLNKRISIMSKESVSDGGGGYKDELVEVAKVWASMRSVSGREKYESQQAQAEVTHKVTIRYREVSPAHLIKLGNRIFDIQYLINVNEENKLLEIQALERQ